MQLQLTPELSGALIERLKKEYAETSAANFALDIISDALVAENTKLKEHNAALIASNTEFKRRIDELTAARGKKRGADAS